MAKNNHVLYFDNHFTAPVMVRGEGPYLYDEEGKRYLETCGGSISNSLAKKALAAFPGVTMRDDPAEMEYPMPLETSGKNDVEVGRLRRDESIEHGLNFWVCGDQIRKGAALNALQIAEYMIAHEMV